MDAVEFFTQKKIVVERWPKEWTRKFWSRSSGIVYGDLRPLKMRRSRLFFLTRLN